MVVSLLDGQPEPGFDCSRLEQTAFFYDWAHADHEAMLSATYRYYVSGIQAAYATVCMDALPLDRSERDGGVRFQEVSALKLAQLGVDHSFQGMGLGSLVLADVVGFARNVAEYIGCRYVTLDAQPDLVGWYQRFGFKRNNLRQKRRMEDARTHGRDPDSITVSMRYNLASTDS